jgi:hypothetical protein
MATGIAVAGLVAGLASAGASAHAAHEQRKEAKKQRRLIEEQQAQEKAAALEERKKKIDALREGGVGLAMGRRTLLSGSELGMTQQSNMDGIKTQLG